MERPTDKIKAMLSARRLGHDANQLLIEIMDRWGGTKAFADSLFVEFQEARKGSLIRANLLEMIQKLVVNNTNHNITKIVDPGDLDDEEIEAEMQAMMKRALDHEHERNAPVPPTYTPPGSIEEPSEPDGESRDSEWDWSSQ